MSMCSSSSISHFSSLKFSLLFPSPLTPLHPQNKLQWKTFPSTLPSIGWLVCTCTNVQEIVWYKYRLVHPHFRDIDSQTVMTYHSECVPSCSPLTPTPEIHWCNCKQSIHTANREIFSSKENKASSRYRTDEGMMGLWVIQPANMSGRSKHYPYSSK